MNKIQEEKIDLLIEIGFNLLNGQRDAINREMDRLQLEIDQMKLKRG